ncbi:two component sensor histidine kinase EnvZ [Neoasaia chiangmaiensis NBRC 101099]|nr:two component sensor histidine kinase EnvZ [Neoasaia chiangmaiensis NBRC 101099]GEN15839.1 ATPase [Neoasaia chiangmaiensis]
MRMAVAHWSRWGRRGEKVVRRVLPRSFLGRSLLIVLIPLLVTQSIALELFYGNYLNVVSRRLSDGVVGELALTMDMLARHPQDSVWILARARERTQLDITLRRHAHLTGRSSVGVLGPMDEDLAHSIDLTFHVDCHIDWNADAQSVRIQIPFGDDVLEVIAPRKRLDVGPIWLFVVWAVGSSLLLFMIAGLFTRNQVRAIRRLAEAAEAFGMGRDLGPIHPEGAQEVRKAAVAFNRMQARVVRFVAQRTAVLAGVSHDLRTPLTRLRLTLAMFPTEGTLRSADLKPDIDDMVADIEEMERLIGSYLSFARGEGAEEPVATDLKVLVDEVAQAAARAGGTVINVHAEKPCIVMVRPDALRRVLTNLADNARRHGGRMAFSLKPLSRHVEITVDDDGPGIPAFQRQRVFRAYDSGEGGGLAGGNGLGLTIARDIMHAHGGTIRLRHSALGGLRVVLTLPL